MIIMGNTRHTISRLKRLLLGETDNASNPTLSLSTDRIGTGYTPASLWDKAYDSLKQEKPQLLSRYEDLLSQVLIKANANSPSTPLHEEDAKDVKNQIPQHSTIARREKMKHITELGLKHMEDMQARVTILGHTILVQDASAQVSEVVSWAQNHVKDAVKDDSYPPAVLAGISLVVPLLKGKVAGNAANQEGLTYIMSQMRCYAAMGSLLLSEDVKSVVKNDLVEHVKDLYALVTYFQVQIIMGLYYRGNKNHFKSVINDGNWVEQQDRLKNKLETVLSNKGLRQLKELVREAERSQKARNGIFKTQRLINKLSLAEDRRCPDFLQQPPKGHRIWVTPNIVYYDSKLTASTFGNAFTIWDTSSGKSLQTLEGHSSRVCSVVFSRDSKLLASASSDQTVKVWDSSSGHCLQTLKGHSTGVRSVVFSHDSKLLASASSDKTVKVWDSSSGHCLQTLKGHSCGVRSVVFSHDSKLLASASSDKTVKVWDSSSGDCLQTLKGHSCGVRSVVFSHDSKLLASASSDKTVKVWDSSSGDCLQTLKGHSTGVRSVVFSDDSKCLASASSDHIPFIMSEEKLIEPGSDYHTVKVWNTSSGKCLRTFTFC